MRRASLLVLSVAFLSIEAPTGALGAPESPAESAAPSWEYRVSVSPALDRLTVRMCFRTYLPKRLVLGTLVPVAHLAPKPAALGGPALVAAEDGRSFLPRDARLSDCVEYEVDVQALVAGGREGPQARRVAEALVARAGDFLLQPALVPEGARAPLAFDLPEGFSASVPWPARGGGGPRVHLLDETAFRWIGHVCVGRFETDLVETAGTTLETAILEGERAATRAGIRTWLGKAAETVGRLFGGRFPRPRVQVVVHPVGGGGDPVVFGSSWQGGGPAVLLYLSSSATDADLPGEWVAVHEMTHLGMPVIARDDAWFCVVFAT